MTRAIVVIARAPEPGRGKSRLRDTISSDVVDKLTRAMVDDTLTWAASVAAHMVVCYSGDPDLLGVHDRDLELVPQPEAEFGSRLEAAIDSGFSAGASEVVLIGTDSPSLPSSAVDQLFESLELHDASIVPAFDGGWIALGVTRPLAGCFKHIQWSVDTTFAQTIDALRGSGRTVRQLLPWYDIDTRENLEQLKADLLQNGSDRCPATAAVIMAIE